MRKFSASQLLNFITETEEFSQHLPMSSINHLVMFRFPQFEEVFSLSIRGSERKIAMMPTIALNLNNSPRLYLTYSDHDLRSPSENAIDSAILGLSIPITESNADFDMEKLFEHKYGTFLLSSDKEKNIKIIDDIKAYIQNMVDLLLKPLSDKKTLISELDSIVADYVPYIRFIGSSAVCQLQGYEDSKVNINLVWDGVQWSAQLQNDYHPLWNLAMCRADFGVYTTESFVKQNFSVPLEKAKSISFWQDTIKITLTESCSNFMKALPQLLPIAYQLRTGEA